MTGSTLPLPEDRLLCRRNEMHGKLSELRACVFPSFRGFGATCREKGGLGPEVGMYDSLCWLI